MSSARSNIHSGVGGKLWTAPKLNHTPGGAVTVWVGRDEWLKTRTEALPMVLDRLADGLLGT